MQLKKFALAIFSTVFLFTQTHAQELSATQQELFVEVYKHYKVQQYALAVENLHKIETKDHNILGVKNYLLGVNYARMNDYPKAVKSFEQAIEYKNKNEDLYYEYGQSLYAVNELEKSRRAFFNSYKRKYKSSSSLYYIGHVSQILEDNKQAKKFYQQILREEKQDKTILQPTSFQLAEVMLLMAEKVAEPKSLVQKYIIPQFEHAIAVDPTSALSNEIKERLTKIKRNYDLDPGFMVNGKVIPDKRYNFDMDQKTEYDNNITQATDLPTTQATQKGSFVYTSRARGQYLLPIHRRYVLAPEVELRNVYHSDRDNGSVFQNDSYQITPALDMNYEHKLFGDQATFSLRYDYDYTARDQYMIHQKKFFAYANSVSIGEKFKIFSGGPTGVRFKIKDYNAYTIALDNKTKSFLLDQIMITSRNHLLLFIFSADFIELMNNTTNSTNSYMFRVDYIIPQFYHYYMLNIGHGFTLLDTKEQRPNRGWEKTFSPQLKISRRFGDNFTFQLLYTYQKKLSENKASFAYSKHQTGFELKFRF